MSTGGCCWRLHGIQNGHVLEFMQFTQFDNSWPVFDIKTPPKSLLALFGGQ